MKTKGGAQSGKEENVVKKDQKRAKKSKKWFIEEWMEEGVIGFYRIYLSCKLVRAISVLRTWTTYFLVRVLYGHFIKFLNLSKNYILIDRM